ncbi:MAG: alpha/beta fold hydrolase [Maricaulaceae bacterium]
MFARSEIPRRPGLGLARWLTVGLAWCALATCAPSRQTAQVPAVGFDGPRFEADQLVSFDGARLGLNRWTPQQDGPAEHVLIAVHGMSEYAEQFFLAGPYWAEHGAQVYAYDQRGFGRSPRPGVWPGRDLLAQDLRAAVQAARRAHPNATVSVLGASMGGAVVMSTASAPEGLDADRIVLVAPAVRGWSTLPLSYRVSLWFASRFAPGWSPRPPRVVTRTITPTDNRAVLVKNWEDPLFLKDTRMDALAGLVDLMEAAKQARFPAHPPVFYAYGANDDIILKKPTFEAVAGLGGSVRTAYYPRGYHMLLRDLSAEAVWADILAFVTAPDGPLPSGAPPIPVSETKSQTPLALSLRTNTRD